jgi:hypothetical protein
MRDRERREGVEYILGLNKKTSLIDTAMKAFQKAIVMLRLRK